LTHFTQGTHEIRLYQDGYNEHREDVIYEGGFATVSRVLSTPGYPRPVFEVYEPDNGALFDDNVITVSGFVQLDDGTPNRAAFTGDTAFLTLNGVDQLVNVSAGLFSTEVSILTGENNLRFRATGQSGQTGVSEPVRVVGTFIPDDIVIILSWNSPSSDIDLHVWNPYGEHCYYANKQITEGFLDIDDVNGYGPETFTATHAMPGTYIVKINSYSLHGDPASDASVTIRLRGAAPLYYGPHNFTVADGNRNDPAAWWEVSVFSMANGLKQAFVQPLGPERIAQIEADMASLPAKE
jgi:hypothetical protein